VSAAALGLRFVLELGALAALGYAGAQVGWWLAALAPIAAAVAWGTFAAPRSSRRLRGVPYVTFEVAFFAVATVALALAATPWIAATFGVIAAADTGVLHIRGEAV
jgi:hypothetical protein